MTNGGSGGNILVAQISGHLLPANSFQGKCPGGNHGCKYPPPLSTPRQAQYGLCSPGTISAGAVNNGCVLFRSLFTSAPDSLLIKL